MAASENKIKKGVLTEKNNYTLVGNDTVIRSSQKRSNLSVASSVPDYANFKQGTMLNSTEAVTPEMAKIASLSPSMMALHELLMSHLNLRHCKNVQNLQSDP